jgi:TolB-like protein
MAGAPTKLEDASPLARLRQRKVVQWSIAYAASAWLSLQVLGYLSGIFAWPLLVQQITTLVLLAGLPLVVVVAWYHGDRGNQSVTRNEIALLLTLAAGAAALAYVVVTRLWLPQHVASGHATATPNAEPVSAQSIAVLPFLDMSEKKDQAYFSEGLSEELIDQLAKIPGMHVPARTSSFYFKDKSASIHEIATALRVANVLEGSVRKSGNTIRITAQLIRADSGYHVWSQSYDRPLNDVFKVQDEIANAVVQALTVSLMGPPISGPAPTKSTDAYELYLQARALEWSAGEGDYQAAASHLKRAVAIDPAFAAAWAELVFALVGDLGWHAVEGASPELCATAHEAADRALALVPTLAAGHRSKAAALSVCDQNLAAAEEQVKRALELDPQNAASWIVYSWLMVKATRWDEAIRYGLEAVSRDPLNAWNYFPVAWAQGYIGQFAQAEATYRKAIELAPTPTPAGLHALHANSLLAMNNPAAALKENALESDDQFRQMNLPLVYDALGRKAEADKEIAVFESKYAARDPLSMAEFYGCRNDNDRALKWLERLSSRPRPVDDVPNRLACLKRLESDPRYPSLLVKWGQTPDPHS